MKRVTLLLLVGFLFSSAAFAAKVKMHHATPVVVVDEAKSTLPQVDLNKISKVSQSPGVSIVGDPTTTRFDWQANGGDQKMLQIQPDGLAHAIYMGATDESGAGLGDTRGSYYSFSDDYGASWTYIGKAEPRRAGFPSMDYTPSGSAVISSHTAPAGFANGISVFVDALAGFGIFTEFIAPRPATQAIWPQVVAPADDRIFFTGYNNADATTAFWNWVNPTTGGFGEVQPLFPLVDNETTPVTVRSAGGKVTTLLINGQDAGKYDQWGDNNIVAMTSTDGGMTFGEPYIITSFPNDTTMETLPAFWVGFSAVYVGEELHVAWTMVDDTEHGDNPSISYFYDSLRLMHWAESVNNGEPTVAVQWDSIHFAGDIGSGDFGGNHLAIDWPKLGVDENGTLIMTFTGFTGDSTTLDPVSNIAYGEIWAVASADDGLQWGEPVNLTNSSDIDDRYSFLSDWNEAGKLNILYQTSTAAGSALQGETPLGLQDYLVLKADIPSTEPYTGPSSVKQVSSVPASYQLEQNYPNPFNPSTAIRFSLEKNSLVKLTVYNMLGERVAVLADGYLNAGTHEATWNASSLSSGLYFYRLEAGNTTLTRKMTLMK